MKIATALVLGMACISNAFAGGGNVTVQIKSGKWVITGDSQPNNIIISQPTTTTLRVSGGASNGGTTTVNGRASADIPANTDVSVQLGDGDDRFRVQESNSSRINFGGGLTVSMAGGVDNVLFNYVRVAGTCDINMGNSANSSGNESASLVSVDTGTLNYATDRAYGANSFSLEISSVRGDLNIRGGASANSVNIASTGINGNLYASMGNENDQLSIQDSFSMLSDTVTGYTNINMGNGRGVVRLNTVNFGQLDVYFSSYKNDQLLVNKVGATKVKFDGSSGAQDRVSGSNNIFRNNPTVLGFEQNSLTWKNQ